MTSSFVTWNILPWIKCLGTLGGKFPQWTLVSRCTARHPPQRSWSRKAHKPDQSAYITWFVKSVYSEKRGERWGGLTHVGQSGSPVLRPELCPSLSAIPASPMDGVVTPAKAEVGTRRPTVMQATCSLHQGRKGQHACHSFPMSQACLEA